MAFGGQNKKGGSERAVLAVALHLPMQKMEVVMIWYGAYNLLVFFYSVCPQCDTIGGNITIVFSNTFSYN